VSEQAISVLRDRVKRLAADAQTQSDWLTESFAPIFGEAASRTGNDELALEFSDSLEFVLDNKWLSPPQAAALHALDAYLESISGQENWEAWTREALFTDQRWIEVRKLAQAALNTLPG